MKFIVTVNGAPVAPMHSEITPREGATWLPRRDSLSFGPGKAFLIDNETGETLAEWTVTDLELELLK